MYKLKTKLFLTSIVFSIFIYSCNKDKTDCQEDICPTVFTTITVTLIDTVNDEMIQLDSFKVIETNTGKDVTPSGYPSEFLIKDKKYPLVSDYSIPLNESRKLTFCGFKGELEVKRPFTAREGCCGVDLISGETEILLNLQ